MSDVYRLRLCWDSITLNWTLMHFSISLFSHVRMNVHTNTYSEWLQSWAQSEHTSWVGREWLITRWLSVAHPCHQEPLCFYHLDKTQSDMALEDGHSGYTQQWPHTMTQVKFTKLLFVSSALEPPKWNLILVDLPYCLIPKPCESVSLCLKYFILSQTLAPIKLFKWTVNVWRMFLILLTVGGV